MIVSNSLMSLCVLATAVGWSCGSSTAQDYPSERPIRLLVPLSAGSPTDIVARQISSVVEKLIHQSIIIENKVGGGSTIAASALIQSPADGYTLLFGSSQIAAAPALIRDLSFNPQIDFTPVLRLAITPTFLAVNASLPIASIADLVAYAKSHPDKLTFASTGQGTSSHLQGTMLSTLAGIKTRHIPYRLATQAVTDVATGEVSFMWFTYQSFEPFVQSGKVRVIAVNGDERSAALPHIPTMKESGFRDFAPSGTWFGLFGPYGLDPRVVQRLQDVFSAAMKDPALMSGFRQQHTLPFVADSKSFSAFVSNEIARYRSIADTAGIVPQ